MNAISVQSFEAQILSELIAPDRPTFSASAAREVLDVSFTAAQKKEMERLLNMHREEEISDEQRQKLEAYIRIGDLLNLLQLKAHNSLAKAGRKK